MGSLDFGGRTPAPPQLSALCHLPSKHELDIEILGDSAYPPPAPVVKSNFSIPQVLVSGAAGQIGYSLVGLLARGDVFGPSQPLSLVLLGLSPTRTLEGVAMELEDCAFPLLQDVVATADVALAFKVLPSSPEGGGAWSPNHFLPPLDYERVATSLHRCNLRIAFRSFCENALEFKRVDLS